MSSLPFFFFLLFIYHTPLRVLCLSYNKQKVTMPHLILKEMLQRKLCCLEGKKNKIAALKTTTFYF